MMPGFYYWLRWSLTFFPELGPQTTIFLISTSEVPGIADVSHHARPDMDILLSFCHAKSSKPDVHLHLKHLSVQTAHFQWLA
jgi:hypothetical protein